MYVEISFICCVFDILFELFLDFRQLRHLQKQKKPVDIFQDSIKEEDFHKSVAYQVELTKFSIVTTLVSFGLLSPFLVKFVWTLTQYGNEILAFS